MSLRSDMSRIAVPTMKRDGRWVAVSNWTHPVWSSFDPSSKLGGQKSGNWTNWTPRRQFQTGPTQFGPVSTPVSRTWVNWTPRRQFQTGPTQFGPVLTPVSRTWVNWTPGRQFQTGPTQCGPVLTPISRTSQKFPPNATLKLGELDQTGWNWTKLGETGPLPEISPRALKLANKVTPRLSIGVCKNLA